MENKTVFSFNSEIVIQLSTNLCREMDHALENLTDSIWSMKKC